VKYHQPDDAANRQNQSTGEPSMSAPSPMPGKPAAQMHHQQPAQQHPGTGWNQQPYSHQGTGYQQPYQRSAQSQPQGWQQGYSQAQPGWNQYQQGAPQGWQQQPQQSGHSHHGWQGGYHVNPWNGGYAPAQPDKGGNSGGTKPPKKNNMLPLIGAVGVIVLLIVIISAVVGKSSESAAVREAVKAYENLYCQGVYVDGIHLGGMNREQARQVVQKSAQLKCDEWHVRLETLENEYVGEINSYHLGMTVHVDDALNEAWAQGHSGADAEENYAAMESLAKAPYHISTALPSGDTSAIDRILNEIAGNIYLAPTDAYIKSFTVQATNPFEIIDGTPGRWLDVEEIKHQVYDMVARMESGVIRIVPQELQPSITKADLEKQTKLIGSAYTAISTTSTAERDRNIERACELISGTIIQPGMSFSFNDVVGPRSKKNGFELATVYNYGKEEPGYGGGVCQVSSTLYVAAIRANMQILKRTQHGLKVNYTDFGLDATVNYDGKKIDFVFKNSTSSPIYIVTKVMRNPQIDKKHKLVVCDIYGMALEDGVTYDLVAETVEIPIPEPTLMPDKKAEYVIYTDETHEFEKGAVGYEVDSYRVKYVNGEMVEKSHMYHDTYPATQPVTYVGIYERPTEEW